MDFTEKIEVYCCRNNFKVKKIVASRLRISVVAIAS